MIAPVTTGFASHRQALPPSAKPRSAHKHTGSEMPRVWKCPLVRISLYIAVEKTKQGDTTYTRPTHRVSLVGTDHSSRALAPAPALDRLRTLHGSPYSMGIRPVLDETAAFVPNVNRKRTVSDYLCVWLCDHASHKSLLLNEFSTSLSRSTHSTTCATDEQRRWIDLCVFGCGGDTILRCTSNFVELSVKPWVMPMSTALLMLPSECVSQNHFCDVDLLALMLGVCFMFSLIRINQAFLLSGLSD